MRLTKTLVLLAVSVAPGCTPRPPVTEIVAADRMLRHAASLRAAEDPTATLYVTLAERRLARAREAAAHGDVDEARSQAIRARADADVAVVVAREAAVRHAARRTLNEASLLADQLR